MTIGYQIVENDESLRKTLLRLVADTTTHGLTIAEARDLIHERHHGHLSGVLSLLQKDGVLTRLADKRDNCEPYILPEHVSGRDTVDRRTHALTAAQREILRIVYEYLEPAESLHGFGTTQLRGDREHRAMWNRLKRVPRH
jgi:DNA-binding PadR family transcriptional regulator